MKGVRTIALRLTGTKEAAEELEEMGEDTSDMIMSQSKMRDLIMNATKVASNNYKGFDIQDELGRYKSTFEIMLGLSQIWDEIRQADLKSGDNRQNLLLESIAGKNRASIASSILQNPDILQSVYQDSSTKAAGSAMEENQKYLDSISGHLAKLKNAWQEMWASAANRDVINGIIDLGTGILNLINNVGGLRLAFVALFTGTIIKGLFNANSLLVKYVQLLNNSRSAVELFSSSLNKTDENGNPVSRLAGWEKIKETVTQSQENSAKTLSNEKEAESLEKLSAAKLKNAEASKLEAEANKQATESSIEKTTATEGEVEAETQDSVANTAQMATEQAVDKTKQKSITTDLQKATSQEAETKTQQEDIITNNTQAASEQALNTSKSAGILGSIGTMVTNPFFWIPAVIMGLTTIYSIIKSNNQELIDGGKEAASTWETTESSISNYEQKYKDLMTQLQNQNLTETEQLDIKKQIYDLQQQITDEYGKSAEGINLVNGNLDEQLEKIKQIQKEEAKRNYQDNTKEYDNAIKKMSETVSHGLFGIDKGYVLTLDLNYGYEELNNKLIEDAQKAGFNTRITDDKTQAIFTLKENAEDSDEALHSLSDSISEVREEVGKDWDNTYFKSFNDQLSDAKKSNDEFLQNFKETAYTGLKTKLADSPNDEGWNLLQDYEQGLKNYNAALLSEDTNQIEKTKIEWEALNEKKEQYFGKGNNAQYAPLFNQIDTGLNTDLEDVYNLRQKMQSKEGKSAIESAFGEIKKNKKDAQKINNELLETAQRVLDLQQEANEWGVVDNLTPITGTKPNQTVFGNIDLNDRQILEWTEDTKKKFAKAWSSLGLGEMPEIGDISTVLGGSGTFGGVEIAYSPILQRKDGKPELLSAESLTSYLNDVVRQATDEKTGKVDLDKILEIDADPKRGGKKLIAGVGKAGDEAVRKLGTSMHFLGTDGALTTSMRDLAHMAREANIPITQIMQSLQQYGNTSGLVDMLRNTVVSAGDVENALRGADDAVSQILADLAQDFGITIETPDDQIQAFINELAGMGLVAAESTKSSQSSLDHFLANTSAKIEQLSSLTSVLQKGQSQTGLTYTKTLDEKGNEVASEVKTIIDAYKTLDGYDLGSLFEETGTGIKLNYDAYRALAQEEEAEIKRQYKLERAALEAQMVTASPEQKGKLQQQIIELDMLSSAYDGATSALAKYINQQNAADYGDTYSMLQGTTIKRGDELLNKGLIGTEEFRSIAQLFSFKSLATEDAWGVAEAYKQGVEKVRKYFTEDAVQGVYQFATDIEQLPEKFGNIAKDADGAFTFDLTDEQLNNLAEHFQVSTDVIEAFFDQIRATGGEVHLWRDGGYDDFKELDQNINESRDKLKELKQDANDPTLINALDFDASDINTIDEIKQKIEDMKDVQAKIGNPETEEWKEAQKIIDELEQKLAKYEEAAENARNASPITVESYQEANEIIGQINDGLLEMQKLEDKNVKVSVTGDKENGVIGSETLQDLANQISLLPDEIQEYIMVEAGLEWKPGMTPEDIEEQFQGKFETEQIEVGADTTQAEQQINTAMAEPHDANVQVDPTSIEQAKTDVEQKISEAEPQVHLAGDPISVAWNGISDHAVNINVGADASEAEATIGEVQEQAEQPLEEPLKIIPENTVQDAANQAGAQQGVTTTKHEQTIQDTQINTTTTADTSALDAAQSKIAAFQSQSGANVVVTVDVVGTEKITDAQTKIAQLIQKAKAKVNVTIGGNNTAFSKSYSDTIGKLNEVAKKDTTAKIKGDNSNLKDKVSEAKNKLNSIDDKKVHITASTSGFDTITSWKNGTYDKLKDKKITITTHYSTTGNKPKNTGGFQGSAHNQGTVMSNGHAYAGGTLSGDWGLPKAEKGALINELGSEIVVSPDGRWQILNGGDPTFANLPKGAIIFNHKQTESLLKKGYVNGSHGKMIGGAFASGTIDDEELEGKAFVTGTTSWNGAMSGIAHDKGRWKPPSTSGGGGSPSGGGSGKKGSGSSGSGKKGGGGGSSSSNKAAKDFLQTLDAIEIHLQRVDAEISKLDTNAAKTFEKFGDRSKSLTDEISLITKEVEKLNKSLSSGNQQGSDTTYANYFAKAKQAALAAGAKNKDEGADAKKKNRPGDELSEYWTKRIKNAVDKGAMLTIDDVHDEGLWKKIQAYQTWYEKGVKLQQKKQEYLNKLAQLTITKLQLIQKSYESYLNLVSEQANTTQQLLEAQSALTKNATINRLDDLISYDQKRIEKLKDEKDDLQKGLDTAVKSGIIKKDSEEYRTWKTNIQKIQTDIRAAENDIVNQTNQKLEYIQSKWESILELLDADIEKYDNLVTKNEYRQSVIPKIYEKGKKKGQYIPTGVTNDSTLGLYENIINKDKEKLKDLQKEYNSIERYLKQAVKDNIIQKNSETWKQWQSRLKTIRNDIIATENDVVEQVVSQLEYIENKWEAVLDDIEQRVDIFEARQELRTEKGYAASKGYYRKQIEGQQQRRTSLERERDDLRNRLMANLTIKAKIDENGNIVPERDKKGKTIANPNGTIVYGSQDYYDWANKIRGVTESIIETDKAIVKLDNDIRQLDWDAFDRVQEKIDNASEEADFLNSIIDEFDQFNKNGRITARGRASEGLIAQQYDLQMKNAQQYGKMVKNLNKQIANDPNNLDLIEQRDKWLKAQQQSIENAHKQKQAMADLIEKGIKKQIEAMSKLVKKYEEMLDAQRSQEQYAKSIADKQKRINSLQKQLTAMGGDDSEEGKVRRQQLQNDLENAQEDLKDSQEDKRISDIKEALSNMQEKYEEILNARIEDIDKLFTETISVINRNGANITDTIEKIAKEVGYDITTVLEKTYSNVKNTKSDNDKGALVSDTGSNGQFKNAGATTIKNTPEATVKNGTYTENGKKVYYYNGKAVSGLFTTTDGKQRYYDSKTGKLAKGWTTVGKNKYYFDKNGNALTGVQKIGGSQYYFDKSGKLHTGTFVAGNKTYTTDKNGAITNVKDTTTLTGKTESTGKIVAGINVDKKPAAAKPTAPPASSPTTPTPSTPAKTTGAPSANYTGLWTDKSGNTYYYVKGKTQTGWKSMKEDKRYFSVKTGRMIKGLQTIGGASYYLDPKTGVLKTGSFTVSNNKYETDKNGKIIKKNGVAVKGHLAKGTASVRRSGMYQVDERGNEVFINKNGKIYTRLDKGTTVLPHDAAINLLKGMTNPTDFIMKNMDMRPNKNITTNNSTTGNTTNYITFDMSGISDYKEFMREAQRDPNFTKYIQEISLGKLNGNNSLKKNSIRFT